jgi:hypothetical protein
VNTFGPNLRTYLPYSSPLVCLLARDSRQGFLSRNQRNASQQPDRLTQYRKKEYLAILKETIFFRTFFP